MVPIAVVEPVKGHYVKRAGGDTTTKKHSIQDVQLTIRNKAVKTQ
jgi:hypothetical protein